MDEIIFLKPVFLDKIWGGNKLSKEFGFNLDSECVGECLAISAHKSGESIVLNGKHSGMTLGEIYKSEPDIFNNYDKEKEFPLLIKILDANADLSVQVHPDNLYANKHEDSLGKAECWYILDCDNDADIVMGHNAINKEELISHINNGAWDKLLSIKSLSKGEFYYIPPGTMHAIRKGTLIYELQQSSDITYRLYDYDRLENGKLRELHVNKSIDVITCPQAIKSLNITKLDECTELLIENEFFKLIKLNNKGTNHFKKGAEYQLVTVIDGYGSINEQDIKKGDSFIIPAILKEYDVTGNVTLMIATE